MSLADTHIEAGGLKIARALHDFVNAEAIPGTGLDPVGFWLGFSDLVAELAPRNKALLEKRDQLQAQIDGYHRERRGKPLDQAAYFDFLRAIGYLVPEPPDFAITTNNVDPEIASIAGPAAGGAGDERTLCAERRQRALGQPV